MTLRRGWDTLPVVKRRNPPAQMKRNEPMISMNWSSGELVGSVSDVAINWNRSTVLAPSCLGAMHRPCNCPRGRFDCGAVISTPRKYITLSANLAVRSNVILASGACLSTLDHVACAANFRSTEAPRRSWLINRFAQNPSTASGACTTARAFGASSTSHPSGIEKMNGGIPLIVPGCTASRAVRSVLSDLSAMTNDTALTRQQFLSDRSCGLRKRGH